MATQAELETALRNADAAGATEDAAKLATALKAMRGAAAPKAPTPGFVSGGKVSDTLDPTEGMGTLEKAGVGLQAGLRDAARGVQGFAARHLGIGDPTQVAADTAESQALEKPVTDTTAGGLGHFAGENLPYMIPGGGAMKVTQGMKMVPRLLAGTGIGATAGATQGALSPTTDPNASDAERAAWGGLWGGAGNVVGEGVGKVVGGLAKAASPYAQQAVDTLKNSAVGERMNLLAANLTDSPNVKAATDALSKVFGLGNPINAAREQNLGALTEAATSGTGTTSTKMLPANVDAMWRNLESKANQFRQGPDVPMAPVEQTAKDAVDRVKAYAAATSQTGDVAKLQAAAKAAAPTATVPPAPSGLLQASGAPFPAAAAAAPLPKMLPASDVMDLRRAASEMAYKETDPVLAAQYKAYRDSLDDALKSTLPQAPNRPGGLTGPEQFDQWRKQWGAAEDVRKAIDKGLSPEGHLLPQHLEAGLPERVRGGASGTPTQNLIRAATARMPAPPAGENRALMTNLLLGGGVIGAGYGAERLTDSPLATGATVMSPLVAALLLGTGRGGRFLTGNLPHQAAVSEYARLLAQQGVQSGANR